MIKNCSSIGLEGIYVGSDFFQKTIIVAGQFVIDQQSA